MLPCAVHVNPIFDNLVWDISQPVETATAYLDGACIAYDSFKDEPATTPRFALIWLFLRDTPLFWSVHSESMFSGSTGPTVGDILGAFRYGATFCPVDGHERAKWDGCLELQSEKEEAGDMDWFCILSGKTKFAGLKYDVSYEDSRWRVTASSRLCLVLDLSHN